MADRPIPVRSEVPEESTWNLKDVFESDAAWQAEYEALKSVPAQLEAFRAQQTAAARAMAKVGRTKAAFAGVFTGLPSSRTVKPPSQGSATASFQNRFGCHALT